MYSLQKLCAHACPHRRLANTDKKFWLCRKEILNMRACEKKVWHLRHPESGIFEEVYFVLREDADGCTAKSDMIAEAERIIRKETAEKVPRKEKKKRQMLLPFLSGALMSASIAIFICLL